MAQQYALAHYTYSQYSVETVFGVLAFDMAQTLGGYFCIVVFFLLRYKKAVIVVDLKKNIILLNKNGILLIHFSHCISSFNRASAADAWPKQMNGKLKEHADDPVDQVCTKNAKSKQIKCFVVLKQLFSFVLNGLIFCKNMQKYKKKFQY